MPHHHHKHHKHSRRISFIERERIEGLLRPLLPDPKQLEFVVRCLLEEGPEHHRGANYVLLSLLGELSEAPLTPSSEGIAASMRLPPHLKEDNASEELPARIPTRVLERLAARDSREFSEMLECLTEGPPQHTTSNVLMLCLLDALLEKKR